jgi:hypothetical protein
MHTKTENRMTAEQIKIHNRSVEGAAWSEAINAISDAIDKHVESHIDFFKIQLCSEWGRFYP